MKLFSRVCGIIGCICWGGLCVAAATGNMQIDTYDYCLATGLLSISVLINCW